MSRSPVIADRWTLDPTDSWQPCHRSLAFNLTTNSRVLFSCILKIVFDMLTVVINERIFVGMLFELIITMDFLAGNPINLEETK